MIEGQVPGTRTTVFVCAVLAALATLAYLPSQQLPFISDDYIQIDLGRKYGAVAGWADLFADPLYRCRATSLVLTYWTERWFGLDPLAFNLSSLVVHTANAALIFALGAWPLIGWRVSAAAACFFAVYEGHQEAVIWYAALPELLVFFFTLLCCLAWIGWMRRGGAKWWAAALCAFVLALASKESAVAVTPVLAVMLLLEGRRWRAAAAAVFPFAVLSALYFVLSWSAQSGHLHYHDGTFSLSAPFWVAWTRTVGRLFWFWGLAAALVLWKYRDARITRIAGFAGAWIALLLLPYSFLTYMPRVPSRHTYLAALGVAVLAGAAFTQLASRLQRGHLAMPALAACVIAHNCGYLWIVKHRQYVERAEPTEELVRQAERVSGPVSLACFPYSLAVADAALRVRLGTYRALQWEPPVTGKAAGACGSKTILRGID
jgi:hypothetical protein